MAYIWGFKWVAVAFLLEAPASGQAPRRRGCGSQSASSCSEAEVKGEAIAFDEPGKAKAPWERAQAGEAHHPEVCGELRSPKSLPKWLRSMLNLARRRSPKPLLSMWPRRHLGVQRGWHAGTPSAERTVDSLLSSQEEHARPSRKESQRRLRGSGWKVWANGICVALVHELGRALVWKCLKWLRRTPSAQLRPLPATAGRRRQCDHRAWCLSERQIGSFSSIFHPIRRAWSTYHVPSPCQKKLVLSPEPSWRTCRTLQTTASLALASPLHLLSWCNFGGLHPECSEKELDNAYRRMAKKMHPDKCGTSEIMRAWA